jgi:hypothetical protein
MLCKASAYLIICPGMLHAGLVVANVWMTMPCYQWFLIFVE